jgi:hypothetical protein
MSIDPGREMTMVMARMMVHDQNWIPFATTEAIFIESRVLYGDGDAA